MANRAKQVLDEALELLEVVEGETFWKAIERSAFADVKRTRTGERVTPVSSSGRSTI